MKTWMSSLALVTIAFLIAVPVQAAPDASGKWSGTFTASTPNGDGDAGPVVMTLKLSGDSVTGSAGPSDEQQMPLQGGKIAGNKITFKININDAVADVTLTVDGDTMKGIVLVDTPDGKVTAKLDLKRAG